MDFQHFRYIWKILVVAIKKKLVINTHWKTRANGMRFCCCCSSFAFSFPMVDICIRYVCIVYMRGVPAGFAERGGSKTFNRKIIIMPMVFYLSVTQMCILKFGESFLIVRHFVAQVYISYRLLGMTLYIAIDAYFRVLMTD